MYFSLLLKGYIPYFIFLSSQHFWSMGPALKSPLFIYLINSKIESDCIFTILLHFDTYITYNK